MSRRPDVPDPSPPVETIVHQRYSAAAQAREEALCCPVDYDPRYLEAIPQEVLERDYGCGDPSSYVEPGETVLDLGSGGGKICFIAAQIVGPKGSVIGIDMNDSMLSLARRAAPEVAATLGYSNVSFRKGRIQDLGLDPLLVDVWLKENPIRTTADLSAFEEFCERLRRERPLVADASIDVVISNCVLNLVRESDRERLLEGIFAVLKPGGRIAICDIVSDEPVPDAMKSDPELWSGCISGAFHEGEVLRRFEALGFEGIRIDLWSEEPFRVVDGIEFRSVTLTARKPERDECRDGNHAVIYRGPWRQVEDDDGHVLRRGVRTAVCGKTYRSLTSRTYASELVPIPPRTAVPIERQPLFDCARTEPRDPRETKGEDYRESRLGSESSCGSGGCC